MSNRLSAIPDYALFDVHQWVDYAELICLSSPDRSITYGDLLDRISPSLRDLRSDLVEEDVEGGIYSLSQAGHSLELDSSTAKSDELCQRIFEYLNYRAASYGPSYPFSIDNKSLVRCSALNGRQRLYVYCLMCSSLHYFPDHKNVLTSEFEDVSRSVLQSVAGPRMKVLRFGKNTSHSADFSGNIAKKIRDLAAAMGELSTVQDGDYPNTSTGDDGLDLVAIDHYGDNLGSRLSLFAQCKCSPTWHESVHSSSYSAWNQKIKIRCPNVNVAMIPFCMRGADGSWHRPTLISGFMLIDRQRLIALCPDSFLPGFTPLAPTGVVDQFLLETEAVE
ncbi:MAG: hypothetical protein JST38_09775 [Bacteroidetes bacterium]|nr:hypothetical protein [Bacteroidota bacterium]